MSESSKYKPTIGLEIHAELKTQTKMFCGCANNPDEKKANANVCPVCMGHPGTLPVINKEAVKYVLTMGVALGGKLADWTEFDRKNYFYPDIPKGYQISQYKYPLVSGGELKGVAITRIHLEEDTGTNVHDVGDYSLVDYNRAGVPLMELVTEPVIHDAKTATDFARELQLVLRALQVSDANMEKGEMRVEANISVNKELGIKNKGLGTKVEVKNLNSFRAVERAIEYEITRQITELEAGEKILQETRGWDESKQKTFSQRQKEESHDYRYFPEPDLPKLKISELPWAQEKILRSELPELPFEKRERYVKTFGIKKEDAEIYVGDQSLGSFFENVVNHLQKSFGADLSSSEKQRLSAVIQLASNYITSDLVGLMKSGRTLENLSAESFSELILMIVGEELSSRGAKDTLAKIVETGGKAREAAGELGVIQIHDKNFLKSAVEKVVKENTKAVLEYKGGKIASLQFLIGQTMKETRGAAKPNIIKELLTELLK